MHACDQVHVWKLASKSDTESQCEEGSSTSSTIMKGVITLNDYESEVCCMSSHMHALLPCITFCHKYWCHVTAAHGLCGCILERPMRRECGMCR